MSVTCLLAVLMNTSQVFAYNNIWHSTDATTLATNSTQQIKPSAFRIFSAKKQDINAMLSSVGSNPENAFTIELPQPDGNFREFKVWETSNMDRALAAKYPLIKSYTAYAVDNKSVTAKLDLSPYGFGAMVYDGDNTYFVDPYTQAQDGYYICYYKHDYIRPVNASFHCGVANKQENELGMARMNLTNTGLPKVQYKTSGAQKHVYRLALACTHQYADSVAGPNPTKAAVLAAMNLIMNRVNGVYETELSIHMDLIADEDTLIFLDAVSDPYDNSGGLSMHTQNQSTIDTRVGNANYDIGHVFCTGEGGVAEPESACLTGNKAKGVTGQAHPVGDAFAIDFVAHEMGHQLGAYHTFNASTSSCAGNVTASDAYEPGSGSTIMAYAGICGAGDNLQAHSDDYFHAKSLDEISTYTLLGNGASCGTISSSGNTPNSISSFSNTYFIPAQTPFEITAPQATDADGDPITYCWEEWDLGDVGKSFNETTVGPILRSFKGTASQTRICPRLDMLRSNIDYYTGEKLPAVDRTINFTLTTRDVHNGWGAFNTPTDNITLLVANTGNPFVVTNPTTANNYWQVGSTATVTWDVAGTNASPVNCSNVDIFLSLDDGQTYPYTLATGIPNNGSASVTVPVDAYTASARVKVKGSNNVFFDISDHGFIINNWPSSVSNLASSDKINVYPVPSSNVVHISTNTDAQYSITVFNAIGQNVWNGNAYKQVDVSVYGWAKGIYNVSIIDNVNGNRTIKRIVVQ